MEKKFTRVLSLMLVLVLMIGILPIAARAANLRFTTYSELLDLVSQQYTENTSAWYVGDDPLVIESNLDLPQNLKLCASGRIIIPSHVTVNAPKGVWVDELIVDGTLKCASSVSIDNLLHVSGTFICDNVTVNIPGEAEIIGTENIDFLGNSHINVFYSNVNSETALQEVCARAATETCFSCQYSFTVQESFTIEEDIIIPNNSTLNVDDGVTVTVNGTLELLNGCLISGHLLVNGTLIHNGTEYYNYINIYPDDGGVLEISSEGTYNGSGTFHIWSLDNIDPSTAFIGMDLSAYSLSQQGMGTLGTSWYYTYSDVSEEPPIQIEPGVYEFRTFAQLQALAAQEYSSHTTAYYIGNTPLVIEDDLTTPKYLYVETLGSSKIVIPSNITLTANYSILCAELIVEGTLENNCNNLIVYSQLNIPGSIVCNDAWINLKENVDVIGWENITFNGYSGASVDYDVYNENELRNACAIAASESRPNWEYQFSVRAPLTISEYLVIPGNAYLQTFENCSITVNTGVTMEILYSGTLWSPLIVYGTLINNCNTYPLYLQPDAGAKVEIAPGGSYMGTGGFEVGAQGDIDPNAAFSGIDLSQYTVTREATTYGWTYWTYTYNASAEPEPTDPPETEPPVTEPALPTITGTYTTDLVMSAADLGVSAPDSVLRATLTFGEEGNASCTWEAVDLTAFRIFFHDMFVNAYYAMAYGAGITDINEIEQFCIDSTGLSVSDYMDTLVTEQAMIESFTPASTSGTYSYNTDHSTILTDLPIMDVPSNPNVENSFVLGGGTLYLNAASWDKADYTFVCTAR